MSIIALMVRSAAQPRVSNHGCATILRDARQGALLWMRENPNRRLPVVIMMIGFTAPAVDQLKLAKGKPHRRDQGERRDGGRRLIHRGAPGRMITDSTGTAFIPGKAGYRSFL